MGNGASTTWDRYEPTPPPGTERNNDQDPQKSTPAKKQDEDGKLDDKDHGNRKQESSSDKTNPTRNDETEKPKNQKQLKAKEEVKQEQEKKEKKPNSDNSDRRKQQQTNKNIVKETEQMKSTKTKNLKSSHTRFELGHKPANIRHNYEPMEIFLDKRNLDKTLNETGDEDSIKKKKPRGPRWKPKCSENNKSFSGLVHKVSETENIVGPVSMPKMKIGYDYMPENTKKYHYSIHGDFVLDSAIKNNSNFIT